MQSSPESDTAVSKVYTLPELHQLRRSVIARARAVPPGSERNQQRQIAKSIRRLFDDPAWLAHHTVGGSREATPMCNRCGTQMKLLAELRSSGPHPAERIFRCYNCNNVISERR